MEGDTECPKHMGRGESNGELYCTFCLLIQTKWRIQNLPGWGRQPIIWPIFPRKLHELEKTDGLAGVGTSPSLPIGYDPPMIFLFGILRSLILFCYEWRLLQERN